MNPLERFVGEVIDDRFHTASALAAAIDMSVSAFLRGVESGSLGVDKLLRLAEQSGASPSVVLRLAGKGDTADLIERLYGVAANASLGSLDRELLDLPSAAKYQLVRFTRELRKPSRR